MTRSASGRPLRFFGVAMASWVLLRVFTPGAASYLPLQRPAPNHQEQVLQAPPSVIGPQALLNASAMASLYPSLRTAAPRQRAITRPQALLAKTKPIIAASTDDRGDIPVDLMNFITFSTDFTNRQHASDVEHMNGFHPSFTAQKTTDRWHAGSWLLWRPGGDADGKAVPAGQLGGSQVGLRLEYDIAPQSPIRIAAYGRLTSALQRPAAVESALGLAIQPIRAIPVSIAMERRVALGSGARNANAVMAVGGFGPTAVASAISVEGYTQAGVVGFARRDAFVDGKLSLSAPLSQTPFRFGAALSGGAQPGVSRLDIGPELQIRLPLPQIGTRLSVEWRERIAGQARPGSGIAVTLAADF